MRSGGTRGRWSASTAARPSGPDSGATIIRDASWHVSNAPQTYYFSVVDIDGPAMPPWQPSWKADKRITGTAALELSLSGGRHSLSTMCIGVGQGIAVALERV